MANKRIKVLDNTGHDALLQDTDNVKLAAAPTQDNHATNKEYVDNTIATSQFWSRVSGNVYPATITDKVGVGVSAPDTDFHVRGTIQVDADNQVSDNYAQIYCDANDSIDNGLLLRHYYGPSDQPDATLTLGGDSTRAGILKFESGDTAGNLTTRFLIDQSGDASFNGNVGIGTTDPQGKLDVNGTILSTPAAYTSNQDEAYLIAGTSGWTGATTNWNTFGFQHRIKSDAGGIPRVTLDTKNGEAFCVNDSGRIGIGTNDPKVTLDVNGAVRSLGGDDPGNGTAIFNDASVGNYQSILAGYKLAFHTGSNNARTEKVRISETGNVGIGTDSPTQKLDVVGAGTFSSRVDALKFRTLSSGSAAYPIICVGNDDDTGLYHAADNTIGFTTGGSARMRISSLGNVGIGESDPKAVLHVKSNNSDIPALGEAGSMQVGVGSGFGLMLGTNSSGTGYIQPQRNDGTTNVYPLLLNHNGGNVGIGTNNPQALLDVNGTAFIGKGGEDSEILRLNTDRSWSFFQRGSGAQTSLDLASGDNKNFTISTKKTGDDDASASVFINGADGNVGIGKTDPQAKLDVNGSIAGTNFRIDLLTELT